MSRVPATDGLQPAVFDAAASTFACDATRRCGPHRVRPLRRIEGMTRAHRAIFFVFRHSSLRARPWSNPCPAGLYTMLRGRCHAPRPMICSPPLGVVCAAGHGRGGFHGALVQPRWKGRRAVDGRRMPLACSSPVAARGVGLAHEKRRSLPWLEARNQHTGGLSRGRHGGRAPG